NKQQAMSMKLIGTLSLVWSLFMATSCWAQTFPVVLDLEGEPLWPNLSGPKWVLPVLCCFSNRNKRPTTPPSVPGIPVTFTPRVATDGNIIIRETRDFTAQFDGASTCVQSRSWRVGEQDPETGRRYVVVGSEPSDSTLGVGEQDPETGRRYVLWLDRSLQILHNSVQNDGQYNIEWCPNCLTL
ncbi:hypothetical protein Tsubulata_036405, partial [Turnera subulata]